MNDNQPAVGLSAEELDAQGATALPDKEVVSILDLNADINLAIDAAAPIDLAVAANANVAAPIDAAVGANVLSVDSTAQALSDQGVIINQGLDADASAHAVQDSALDQGNDTSDRPCGRDRTRRSRRGARPTSRPPAPPLPSATRSAVPWTARPARSDGTTGAVGDTTGGVVGDTTGTVGDAAGGTVGDTTGTVGDATGGRVTRPAGRWATPPADSAARWTARPAARAACSTATCSTWT